MTDTLISLDKQLLLWFNGSDSVFIDTMAMTLTNAKTWIPLYAALLFMVVRANIDWRRILLVVACAGMCVLLAGTINDEIVKPLVARLRPTHDLEIGALVDIVDGYRGGRYGFFSSHAANTFSLAVFFSLLVRNRYFSVFLILWSLTNCWTRMYLGVHFPFDIFCGLLWGGCVGTGVYAAYRCIQAKYFPHTTSVYGLGERCVVMGVLLLTFVYAIVRGLPAAMSSIL